MEQRLIELEVKFSHQDIAIEELQKTVHEQYLLIASLEKSLKQMKERLKSVTSGDHEIGPANEKPPHY